MKNYWLDRIKEREIIVAARWTPPSDDESGWFPIRPPLDCCADAKGLPAQEPLYVSTPPAEPNVFQTPQFFAAPTPADAKCDKRWERMEIISGHHNLIMKDDGLPCGEWAKSLPDVVVGDKQVYDIKVEPPAWPTECFTLTPPLSGENYSLTIPDQITLDASDIPDQITINMDSEIKGWDLDL